MSDSPDPTDLKFEPFSNVIINRHENDEQGTPEYCRETAAILYAIAYGVVQARHDYSRILERKITRDQERFRKLKEQADELEEKLVELDRRLRDPNRLRPDPLGPSLPRGGKPDVVTIRPRPPLVASSCPGSWTKPSVRCEDSGDCDNCGRTIGLQRGGYLARHSWGGKFSA